MYWTSHCRAQQFAAWQASMGCEVPRSLPQLPGLRFRSFEPEGPHRLVLSGRGYLGEFPPLLAEVIGQFHFDGTLVLGVFQSDFLEEFR